MIGIINLLLVVFLFALLYFLKNKGAKWLWLFFMVTILSFGVKIENAFLETIRVVLNLASLVLAISASSMARKLGNKND